MIRSMAACSVKDTQPTEVVEAVEQMELDASSRECYIETHDAGTTLERLNEEKQGNREGTETTKKKNGQ